MTLLLASVRHLAEADIAKAAGADVLDLKDPSRGVLGALSAQTIAPIMRSYSELSLISATVGDHPCTWKNVEKSVRLLKQLGVPLVKIGLFNGELSRNVIHTLTMVKNEGTKPVLVLFADRYPSHFSFERIKKAGAAGIMLDTAEKRHGSLTALWNKSQLGGFVKNAQSENLFCGLAGSLTLADIPQLLPLKPDLLGFRGALCLAKKRTLALNQAAISQVRRAIPADFPVDLKRFLKSDIKNNRRSYA